MRDLIVKLESLKDSKEREKIVQGLKDAQAEQNKFLLEDKVDELFETQYYSEADMIKHELKFIDKLI
jgi:hypothetical protein